MSNALTDWLGAAGKHLTEAVTLYHPSTWSDGQVTAWTSQSAEALVVRYENTLDEEGELPLRSVRLVFLLPETPSVSPGDEIAYAGSRYRITGVQLSRSLAGRVVAQRCQAG